MKMFISMTNDMDDNEVFNTSVPIRTEVMEAIMIDMQHALRLLLQNITNSEFKKIDPSYTRCVMIYNMMNETEKDFLNWYTSVHIYGNEAIAMHYRDQRLRHGGIKELTNGYESGYSKLFLLFLDRMIMCLSTLVSEFNERISTIVLSDIKNIPIATEDNAFRMDMMHTYWLSKTIEYAAAEYIAMRNIPILKHNRENRQMRTCELCGTEFQRLKSKNIHVPKCNGMNRGYIQFVQKEVVEKTSEW